VDTSALGPKGSEHQASVDWKKVAGKHNLGVVRVADGDHRDSWYSEARVREIREAGLLLAPYYFARVASPQNRERDGEAEAKMAIDFAKSRGWKWPGDLPLIYDFETTNAQPNPKVCRPRGPVCSRLSEIRRPLPGRLHDAGLLEPDRAVSLEVR
jgi:hypothetical protein